ncbi:MAG: ComEA family DNA-binding protein [Gemmatales bacterium]
MDTVPSPSIPEPIHTPPVPAEQSAVVPAHPTQPHPWSWPRSWEFALAFTLGVCVVIMVQSAWKLIQPPVPLTQSAMGVDLNAADLGTLRQLPGVGPHLAARIVDHREKNGPFNRIDDLKAVHGIGPATLERLRQVVMVSTTGESAASSSAREMQPLRSGPKSLPSEPLDINTASKEQFMSLPGIGATLADRILEERAEHGPFTSVKDLSRVRGIKGKTLEKLLPYVTVKKPESGV